MANGFYYLIPSLGATHIDFKFVLKTKDFPTDSLGGVAGAFLAELDAL
jgi:hypothetical protein